MVNIVDDGADCSVGWARKIWNAFHDSSKVKHNKFEVFHRFTRQNSLHHLMIFRFLPPKYDYHRPIPHSLLPPAPPPSSPSNGSPGSEIELGPLLNGESSPQGTRNRRARLGSRVEEPNTSNTSMSNSSDAQTLDCVICYNEIDINDRTGYMLAPCLHIFHKTCLEQWMEVKMECPICRKNLPAI